MNNVLVVDDEIISRIGISSILEWESEGFTLVDAVVNGEEALKILREQQIDLVITDIKMPVMTGIDLIKAAKEEGIETAFVVLSSYDDYAYVREALKLGAVDYILKLDLDKSHLQSVLEKVKEQIANKKTKASSPKQITKQAINSARRDFLKHLLYGKVDFSDQIQEKLDYLQLEFPHDRYVAIMFHVENPDHVPSEGSIRVVIEEVLEDYDSAYMSETARDEFCVLYNIQNSGEQEMNGAVRKLSNRIAFIMRQYFNQKVVFYISRFEGTLEDVPLTYLQVCQACSFKNVVSDSNMVHYTDVLRYRSDQDLKQLEDITVRIEKSLNEKNYQKVTEIFDELIKAIDESKYVNLGQINYFLFSLIYLIEHHTKENNIPVSHAVADEKERYEYVQQIKRKSELLDFLESFKKVVKDIDDQSSDNYIIRNVKCYLMTHYKEGIVLKEVSEEFGLTNTYLSMLFKKETGETLKGFLTSLKIGQAKELLKSSTMQIVEIANEVGYDDEHYFSRIFKQKTGMTPTQYRNVG